MSAWTKTKRLALAILQNTVWYSSAALGTLGSLAWAWNVFSFMTWILVLIVLFLSFGVIAGHLVQQPIKFEYKPSVPIWLDLLLDSACMLLIVAFGHWFYGLLVLIQMLCYQWFIRDIQPSAVYPGVNTPA